MPWWTIRDAAMYDDIKGLLTAGSYLGFSVKSESRSRFWSDTATAEPLLDVVASWHACAALRQFLHSKSRMNRPDQQAPAHCWPAGPAHAYICFRPQRRLMDVSLLCGVHCYLYSVAIGAPAAATCGCQFTSHQLLSSSSDPSDSCDGEQHG
jgi:hypothetical protein